MYWLAQALRLSHSVLCNFYKTTITKSTGRADTLSKFNFSLQPLTTVRLDSVNTKQVNVQYCRIVLFNLHRSRNLQDSPEFLVPVPGTGRLYYNCIVGPG